MLNMLVGNWRTTLLGVISGIATFMLAGPGVNLPTNKQEWFGFLAGITQIVWGVIGKDAATGSKAIT